MINQLFFTTDNLDILDLPLCKHSFNFLKKDDQGISMVNAATYLKKNTDSLRNALDNDLFSVAEYSTHSEPHRPALRATQSINQSHLHTFSCRCICRIVNSTDLANWMCFLYARFKTNS